MYIGLCGCDSCTRLIAAQDREDERREESRKAREAEANRIAQKESQNRTEKVQ